MENGKADVVENGKNGRPHFYRMCPYRKMDAFFARFGFSARLMGYGDYCGVFIFNPRAALPFQFSVFGHLSIFDFSFFTFRGARGPPFGFKSVKLGGPLVLSP